MKKIIITLLFVLLLIPTPLYALNDGTYLVSRTTSYVNPLTGKTEDGGSNIALGDSMISNIVESQILIEQTNGKYYVTVGLGLASNVTNVRFKTMNSTGTFTSTNSTLTGSSSASGDTVHHYRLQVRSLDDYLSPIIYVTPMARDVQFFIKLNLGSASPGTGIYHSQMIPSSSNQTSLPGSSQEVQGINTQKQASKEVIEQKNQETAQDETSDPNNSQQTVGIISKDELLGKTGLNHYLFDQKGQYNKKIKLTQKNLLHKTEITTHSFSYSWIIILGFIFIVGGIVYVKKIKK